jgi:hypothetical protein
MAFDWHAMHSERFVDGLPDVLIHSAELDFPDVFVEQCEIKHWEEKRFDCIDFLYVKERRLHDHLESGSHLSKLCFGCIEFRCSPGSDCGSQVFQRLSEKEIWDCGSSKCEMFLEIASVSIQVNHVRGDRAFLGINFHL